MASRIKTAREGFEPVFHPFVLDTHARMLDDLYDFGIHQGWKERWQLLRWILKNSVNAGATDVTPLFTEAGIYIPDQILISETSQTYEVDPVPENNWVFYAMQGFQELGYRLHREGRPCNTFWSIGTGPGIDAIAAYYTLHPRTIFLSDINGTVVLTAAGNLMANLPENNGWGDGDRGGMTRVHNQSRTRLGLIMGDANLVPPDMVHPVDVIYGNLPNLPAKEIDTHSMATATFYDEQEITTCPPEFDHYLLALQREFLRTAHMKLKPGDSVVLALGGRMPHEIVEKMFQSCGYRLELLRRSLKVQTQPEQVIPGYAGAEKANGVRFTYFDESLPVDIRVLIDDLSISSNELEKELEPFALFSQQAFDKSREGKPVCHLVSILRGIKVS